MLNKRFLKNNLIYQFISSFEPDSFYPKLIVCANEINDTHNLKLTKDEIRKSVTSFIKSIENGKKKMGLK